MSASLVIHSRPVAGRRVRPLVARGALALFATVLALAAVEGALRRFPTPVIYYRVIRPVPAGSIIAPHRSTLYANHPGFRGEFNSPYFRTAVRINDCGLRGGPLPYARQAGVKRYLVLGDSFVFGWGVQEHETVSRVLEDRLPGVELVNTGCLGWGTGQQAQFLAEEGWRYAPDYVVAYFFCNDPLETVLWERWQSATRGTMDPGIHRAGPAPEPSWLGNFLDRHSATWVGVGQLVERLAGARVSPAALRAPANAEWEAETRALDRLRAQCRARMVPLLIGYIPFGAGPSPGDALGRGPWFTELREYCERTRLPYLDLTPSLDEAARRQSVCIPVDEHWNAFGHRVAAEATARRMRELGWID